MDTRLTSRVTLGRGVPLTPEILLQQQALMANDVGESLEPSPTSANQLSKVRPAKSQQPRHPSSNPHPNQHHPPQPTSARKDTSPLPKIMSDPPPDARLRQDPADCKDYLDLDGSVLKIYSFWNLSRVEEGMSLYRSGIRKDGTIRLVKVPITNPEVVAAFYKPLKSLLVEHCTRHGFRGCAFAEKVQKHSPLNDILQFIYWSPVMTNEHRYFFKMEIMDLYQEAVSRLKEPSLREFVDATFMAPYIDRLEKISTYFEMEAANPVPLPTDISDTWLGEFGTNFTANYKKALAGDPDAPFKVQVPIRNQHGMSKFNRTPRLGTANSIHSYERLQWCWYRRSLPLAFRLPTFHARQQYDLVPSNGRSRLQQR